MKLYLCVSIALSLVWAALSSSLDGYPYDDLDAQYFPNDWTNLQADENMPEPDFTNFKTNEVESNAEYISELNYQLQGVREDDEAELQSYLRCSLTQSKSYVLQGSKIALQTLYNKPLWLDCDTTGACVKSSCPKLYMEGNDWKNCEGEVFQIYRARGAGRIEVGDKVGLYHPKRKEWFSIFSGVGRRDKCPGAPTNKFGFSKEGLWGYCTGEVFQIYASGKNVKDPIMDHDEVTLYYERANQWVSFRGPNPGLHSCPGGTRPPPPERYDACYGEVAELWLGEY